MNAILLIDPPPHTTSTSNPKKKRCICIIEPPPKKKTHYNIRNIQSSPAKKYDKFWTWVGARTTYVE